MDKYIGRIVDIARSIGSVTNGEISEANKFFPKRIVLSGYTKEGEAFELRLQIGERTEHDS